MMCVKSYIAKSKLHGFGVYAGQFIPKGTVIWKFNRLIDKVLDEDELKSLPELNREFVLHYSYKTDGKYILGGDFGIYFNHSDNPNTGGFYSRDGFGITKASRDIQKDEEFTGNYGEFDENFEEKLKENEFKK